MKPDDFRRNHLAEWVQTRRPEREILNKYEAAEFLDEPVAFVTLDRTFQMIRVNEERYHDGHIHDRPWCMTIEAARRMEPRDARHGLAEHRRRNPWPWQATETRPGGTDR